MKYMYGLYAWKVQDSLVNIQSFDITFFTKIHDNVKASNFYNNENKIRSPSMLHCFIIAICNDSCWIRFFGFLDKILTHYTTKL